MTMAMTMANNPDAQRKLARTLLIELMAYQFASPVQWIETQDAILSHKECASVIEIGPTPTLVGMFQRTLGSRTYQTQECTRSKPRRLLNSERDTAEVYFEGDVGILETPGQAVRRKEPSAAKSTPPIEDAPPPVARVVSDAVPEAIPRPVVLELEDEAVKARDIVTTIISRALKKTPRDFDGSKSIKALAGGRSTLENEIVGDLHAEFGSLPDRAEDLPLNEVCNSIQSVHKQALQLGKVSTSMVNSLFTSKFPSTFTTAVAREHLSSRWGLQQGRQDSCLLLAVAEQPSTRILTEAEAKIFFDCVVKSYAAKEGISLDTRASTSSVQQNAAVDPEAVRKITESQKALSQKLLNVYASHAGLDQGADRRALDALRHTVDTKLQSELDLWSAEHGEEYAKGIRPRFDARKARSYDSAWNWARQRLLELFNLVTSVPTLDSDRAREACYAIANAADEAIFPVLSEMVNTLSDNPPLRSIFIDLEAQCRQSLEVGPLFKGSPKQMAPRTIIDEEGVIQYLERPRNDAMRFADLALPVSPTEMREPYLHLKEKAGGWNYSQRLTEQLHGVLTQIATSGESFRGQTVLLTGAGFGSIGAAMIKHFLQGGAKVVTTTSSLSPEVAQKYQNIYMDHGARGSQLVVVPFNQASVQDVTSLISYIYSAAPGGLGWDLDYIVPFAGISEAGRKLDGIDSKSELAHRLMLTNVLRLLGTIKTHKEKYHCRSHPTQVILPLSPNHGTFGGDGLYGESKLALETLLNRWHAEDWRDYLCICGAVIGWTRGTGLMNQNDLVAEGVEASGHMRTFSQEEMAYALVCLCVQTINELCQEQPLYVDLTGGMGTTENLPHKLQAMRQDLKERSEILAGLLAESRLEQQCSLTSKSKSKPERKLQQRAHVRIDFPRPLDYAHEIRPLAANLLGMVDLHRTVVVTGFSELGPRGNARTRWEMEAYGQFSLEGVVEMAWLMGYIKHYAGVIDGTPYSGWVDATTKKPVADIDVKPLYEERILSNSGIRLVPADEEQPKFLHEVILQEDLEPLYLPRTLADEMKAEHGEYADVQQSTTPDLFKVQLRKGSRLYIPRAMQNTPTVAGLIPTGWDPRTYGIPEDIITQVDPVTLYTLVCTVEALLFSGITDPYELYQYIHVSDVGSCIGSGLGGASSLRKMFSGRQTNPEIQKDILQETFINTTAAWVNMLLLSASGPLRTPVGACATAIESLELGYETISSGKAQFCLVGGCDDFIAETSQEFANMKATANAADEIAKGRAPHEMSRPATSTRSGFVESQGAGIQVLTTAALALKMGLPIRGVVAFVNTSSDKASRSVPAPGRGVLTNAKQMQGQRMPSPLMDIANRRKRLDFRLRQINEARDIALQDLPLELDAVVSQDPSIDTNAYITERRQQIIAESSREQREAKYTLGNTFWHNNPHIAPLSGALATWGLTINDLSAASLHGTSTVLNDKNESSVLQDQLRSLGRRPGNLLPSVFQKSLTGHSKGAAGAWMLNGALQMLESAIVPGNRNADNIDAALKEFDLLVYTQKAIRVEAGLKAISLTSFGFGQKGAQALVVHPRYLFATIDEEEYGEYMERCERRKRRADAYFYEGVNGNSLFRAKVAPPWGDGGDKMGKESAVYLDPLARFS
ncbi:Fatty acid synthase subunit alpha [Aspergillus mulundensis]|uniref:Fatty acid synthase subunit alpha n=1 Tax=Aspergillus mulundensis TaxID=1810919 RepID=A0A3D8QZN0_9EURO|nr:Fatty acid synthase subunit alpha [Aspergillus mulundensis]RDW67215.1 Fatty acid synthase subunit alpha [Aspergillus mulundensis]